MAEFGGEGPGGFDPNQLFPEMPRSRSKPSGAPNPHSSRVPPHNLEAERSVLGAILVQNDVIDQVREVGLVEAHFYLDAHRKIFQSAIDLNDRRQPVDLLTLTESLRAKGVYDAVGGSSILTSLFDEAFDVGNVSHYATIVRDKAVVRNMIEACSKTMAEGFEGVENTDAYLNEAETRVFKVANEKYEGTITELKDVLLGNMTAIEELALRKTDVTGLSTGFTEFDRVTTGLHGGQVMIVAARPGMGKTSWLVSAIQHAAVSDNAVVAFFSLEMSKEELGFRFLSSLSRIDSRKLKVGRLSQQDWHRLAEAADKLSKSKIYIDDSGGMTAMDIRGRCRRLRSREKKLDLVVVDYLQLMRGSKGGKGEASREREISEISRNLKELAKELKVPIIALSQLNRGVEMRQDKRPTLADLRESGAIEQDADLVCFIHREEYYDKETEARGIAEFIVAKNRAGETTTCRMAWLGQYTLFANLSSEDAGTPVDSPRPDKGDITL